MANVVKDLGAVSAYALAVKHGYKGTEEEWVAAQEAARVAAETAAENAEKTLARVGEQSDAAIEAVKGQETLSIEAVEAAGSNQVDTVEAKGAEVLNSIPADYTKMVADAKLHAPCIACDASGALVTVSDAAARPAVQVVSDIVTVQSGTGDPSPDNVRPISGWDTVSIWRSATYDPTAAATLIATLPETVYGGSIDWTTGLLTVTHRVQTFDGTEAWAAGSTNSDGDLVTYKLDNRSTQATAVTDNNRAYHLCSHYTPAAYKSADKQTDMTCATLNSYQMIVQDTTAGTLDGFKGYLAKWAADGTPMTMVFPIKPAYYSTIQLTPQQLDMLKGYNAVWSDSGDTSLVYVADTKMYIDNKFTALQNAILAQGANI